MDEKSVSATNAKSVSATNSESSFLDEKSVSATNAVARAPIGLSVCENVAMVVGHLLAKSGPQGCDGPCLLEPPKSGKTQKDTGYRNTMFSAMFPETGKLSKLYTQYNCDGFAAAKRPQTD